MDDQKFLRNVREARENGFDLVCSECGVGIYDESDAHEMFCSQNPEIDKNEALAASWAEKQK